MGSLFTYSNGKFVSSNQPCPHIHSAQDYPSRHALQSFNYNRHLTTIARHIKALCDSLHGLYAKVHTKHIPLTSAFHPTASRTFPIRYQRDCNATCSSTVFGVNWSLRRRNTTQRYTRVLVNASVSAHGASKIAESHDVQDHAPSTTPNITDRHCVKTRERHQREDAHCRLYWNSLLRHCPTPWRETLTPRTHSRDGHTQSKTLPVNLRPLVSTLFQSGWCH